MQLQLPSSPLWQIDLLVLDLSYILHRADGEGHILHPEYLRLGKGFVRAWLQSLKEADPATILTIWQHLATSPRIRCDLI